MALVLDRDKWYAAEFIGEEFEDDIRSYSPIKVRSLTPRKTGSKQFDLSFYHANYPEGVREKTYELRTIERNSKFILAVSTTHKPVRLLLIYSMKPEWLTAHFDVELSEEDSAVSWLERNA